MGKFQRRIDTGSLSRFFAFEPHGRTSDYLESVRHLQAKAYIDSLILLYARFEFGQEMVARRLIEG